MNFGFRPRHAFPVVYHICVRIYMYTGHMCTTGGVFTVYALRTASLPDCIDFAQTPLLLIFYPNTRIEDGSLSFYWSIFHRWVTRAKFRVSFSETISSRRNKERIEGMIFSFWSMHFFLKFYRKTINIGREGIERPGGQSPIAIPRVGGIRTRVKWIIKRAHRD